MTGNQGPNLKFEGQGGKSLLARWLLCVCGYEVRCEVLRYGDGLGEFVFFDDTEASLTQGERVWDCPGCRCRLGFLGLQA